MNYAHFSCLCYIVFVFHETGREGEEEVHLLLISHWTNELCLIMTSSEIIQLCMNWRETSSRHQLLSYFFGFEGKCKSYTDVSHADDFGRLLSFIRSFSVQQKSIGLILASVSFCFTEFHLNKTNVSASPCLLNPPGVLQASIPVTLSFLFFK